MKSLFTIIFVIFCLQLELNAQCNPDRHNTNWNDGWISCQASPNPNNVRGLSHWIQYDLGDVYLLGQTHFWNSNIPDSTNRGFQEVALDYSIDGNSWDEWGTFTIDEANGSLYYEGTAGPSLNGIAARYVLLTAISNYGASCYGLSEMRFNIQNAPVPVEVVEFELLCNKDFLTEIQWKSSAEINNQFFTIERSLDGYNWEIVETVDGQGTKLDETNYSWLDREYLAGSKLYRLSQTDFNGRTAIIETGELSCSLVGRNVEVSPNPFEEFVMVRVETPESSSFDYVLIDALGRVVRSGQMMSVTAVTEFQLSGEGLNSGAYTLNIIYPNSKEQIKLIKI